MLSVVPEDDSIDEASAGVTFRTDRVRLVDVACDPAALAAADTVAELVAGSGAGASWTRSIQKSFWAAPARLYRKAATA